MCIFFPRLVKSAQAQVPLSRRSSTSSKKIFFLIFLLTSLEEQQTEKQKGCSCTTWCERPTSSSSLLSVERRKQLGMFLFFPFQNIVGLEGGNSPYPMRRSEGRRGRSPVKNPKKTDGCARRTCTTFRKDLTGLFPKVTTTRRLNLMVMIGLCTA